MRHVFLSPHPDDAVLSCGGIISQSGDEEVIVFTVMAGDPPDPLPPSPFVTALHERWGTKQNPMAVRRAEDQQAIESLGAQVVFGEWQDCIYRTDPSGTPLYVNDDDLFGPIKPADPLLNSTLPLTQFEPFDRLYVPLGAGNHVDHLLVRHHALQSLTILRGRVAVFFYEEYPYSSESGEVLYRYAGQTPLLAGQSAVQRALASLPLTINPVIKPLSEDAIRAKIKAIAAYQSQISTFWEDEATMAQRVREYTAQVARNEPLAERLWIVE